MNAGLSVIEEGPFISASAESPVAKRTCLCVLHDICWFNNCYFRSAPHAVTENEVQRRVVSVDQLFQVVRQLPRDESSFESEHPRDSAWAREILFQLEPQRKLRAKGARCTEFRPAPSASALPDIEGNLRDGKCRKGLQGIGVHFGNAPKETVYPAHSPAARNPKGDCLQRGFPGSSRYHTNYKHPPHGSYSRARRRREPRARPFLATDLRMAKALCFGSNGEWTRLRPLIDQPIEESV
jgi:hypothetical protein